MMGLQIGWDCISFCRALVPSSSPLMGADDDGLPLMSTECDAPLSTRREPASLHSGCAPTRPQQCARARTGPNTTARAQS